MGHAPKGLGKMLTFTVAMKKVHLTREQRYAIFLLYNQNCSQKTIAETIGKNKSVISRELKRNAKNNGKYSFEYAQDMANLRKERMQKRRKLSPWLEKKIIRQDKANGGTLYKHTRHKLKHRKRPMTKPIAIKNRLSIDQRPKIVDTKQRFGDWEIDTIVGKTTKELFLLWLNEKRHL